MTVGRALGAVSVVLSLLFVGWEIRQNMSVAKNEAHRQMVAGFTEFNGMMATDGELAALWTRISQGLTSESFDHSEN